MNDKELLELAAKAAGKNVYEMGGIYCNELGNGHVARWSPLTDDGDALRLAVKICCGEIKIKIVGTPDGFRAFMFGIYDDGATPEEAVRRAIVRAAAEIGKELP